jgi:hypothetical protein
LWASQLPLLAVVTKGAVPTVQMWTLEVGHNYSKMLVRGDAVLFRMVADEAIREHVADFV